MCNLLIELLSQIIVVPALGENIVSYTQVIKDHPLSISDKIIEADLIVIGLLKFDLIL